MRALAVLLFSIILVTGNAPTAQSVEPGEVLADPGLEARARDLSQRLRCLVCQNQSIDDSDAPLAKDLRVLVRERLVAGDSDTQVVDYLVGRYGEFVLLQPRVAPHTLVLWFGGPLLIVIGAIGIIVAMRRKPQKASASALSAEEEAELKKLLRDSS